MLRLMIISLECGSISPVLGVVEIVITVFLSFNGSIAAYQSLQLDAGVTTADSHCSPVRYFALIGHRNNLRKLSIIAKLSD